MVVIGYNPVPCRTNEGLDGLNVQVDLLVGLLARNLSVQFDTSSQTAIGKATVIVLHVEPIKMSTYEVVAQKISPSKII